MANKILLAGKSGSGKTYSLRNLDPKTTFIICPDMKNPPFEGWRKNYTMVDPVTKVFNPKTCNYYKVTDWIKIREALNNISAHKPDIKTVVIDTITYAMISEFMAKVKVVGYTKFSEMGLNVYDTINMIDGLRDDLTVIICAHTDYEEENGTGVSVFAVPGGRLVKDVVKPVGMFLMVLETKVKKVGENIEYKLMVSNNTTNMAKVPAGIFTTSEIDNDMQVVLDAIHKYEYGE